MVTLSLTEKQMMALQSALVINLRENRFNQTTSKSLDEISYKIYHSEIKRENKMR